MNDKETFPMLDQPFSGAASIRQWAGLLQFQLSFKILHI